MSNGELKMKDRSINQVRPMTAEDLELILSWRNHKDIRRFMFTQKPIKSEDHFNWFERTPKDPLYHLLIFEKCGNPCGFVSLKEVATGGIADWDFYVAPAAPKGTGRQLGLTTLHYVFNKVITQGLWKGDQLQCSVDPFTHES